MESINQNIIRAFLEQPNKRDGEIIGLDFETYGWADPVVVVWDAKLQVASVSQSTIFEYGVRLLGQNERERCGFTDLEVEIAKTYYEENGFDINRKYLSLAVLEQSLKP
jgi:hypothetical protein